MSNRDSSFVMSKMLERMGAGRSGCEQSAISALATQIVETEDIAAVEELVELVSGSSKDAQADAIKILGEISGRLPELLVPHVTAIGVRIASATGVMRWEGLTVLDGVASVEPDAVAPFLDSILDAIDQKSVIARDRAVSMLVRLSASNARYPVLMPVLIDVLGAAPVNQLPAYAERVCGVARPEDSRAITTVLEARLGGLDQAAKVARIRKAMAAMNGRRGVGNGARRDV